MTLSTGVTANSGSGRPTPSKHRRQAIADERVEVLLRIPQADDPPALVGGARDPQMATSRRVPLEVERRQHRSVLLGSDARCN
jgi:hypothetical protein